MNNVNPPSSFTAHILLHTYTQERSQSSAESGIGIAASQHFGTLRLTPPLVSISACQPAAVGEFQLRHVESAGSLSGVQTPWREQPLPPSRMGASVIAAFSIVIPAQAGIHCTWISRLQERFTGPCITRKGPAARADKGRGGAWKAPPRF